MNAVFRVDFAGPSISIQDRGRSGFLRFGVTESGPMDRVAFTILRHALEESESFRALEVSAGGLVLTCVSGNVTAGIVGGDFDIRIEGEARPGWAVFPLRKGQRLAIRPGPSGSWCYLGFAGEVVGPDWLGSRAAHLASGLCGQALRAGEALTVAETRLRPDLHATFPAPRFACFDGQVRVVIGPQEHCFTSKALEAFTTQSFRLTQDYDRMGMRLRGPDLTPKDALSIPSEALSRGSIQVPGHGDPLILMADHQTTGGYPKIATVVSADQDRIAQARPGDRFRFEPVSVERAISIARKAQRGISTYIEGLPDWRGSPDDRLHRVNLIDGVVAAVPD